MTDRKWWKEAVVYQIYPKSFMDSNEDGIGDIKGITEKLGYLKELGVDVIWISPMYESPGKDNGYDISDYCAIDEKFGTMDDFDEMLEKAHGMGLKIVLDLVVNHTSNQHRWFKESRKSKDNPYRDYYIWKDPVDGHEPTNWGGFFGGSVWQFDEMTGQYYLHQFVPEQPDLNWDNPKVRHEVFDMMTYWCDKGIDGFRMDVISLISKPEEYVNGTLAPGEKYVFCGEFTGNGHRIHEYLQEMNQKVLSKYDLITVGEASCVTLEEAKKYANSDGSELNMVFEFEHSSVDDGEHGKWVDKKLKLTDLKKKLNEWETGLQDVAWNSLYWDNHDQPRIVSRWGSDSEKYRVLSAKMLGTCLHMMQGTPYIFQGEEIGMTNMTFKDISECNDVEEFNVYTDLVTDRKVYTHDEMMHIISKRGRDNARTPMQWNDKVNAGFTTGTPWFTVNPNYKTINAENAVKDPNSIFNYYKKLISLRKKEDVIVYGQFELIDNENEEIFAYTRTYEDKKLLCICNFTNKNVFYSDEIAAEIKSMEIDLNSVVEDKVLICNYEDVSTGLRPYEAVVFVI